MKGSFRLLILTAFSGICLLSCSPKLNRSVLSVFFDGVPVRKPDSVITEDNIAKSTQLSDSSLALNMLHKEEIFYHYPYKEKDCNSCHDENSKSELIADEPQLCYACHEDFKEKLKFLHGPVAGGYCTKCHNPHESKNPKLLIRTGQQLCFYCHDPKSITGEETHSGIGDTDCIECHNAHGGDDRSMFK
jgi:predicted CXXCH cytochrome family protein